MTGPSPRTGARAIPAYTPGKARHDGVADAIKLSANENALGCSALAREAYASCEGGLSSYPDMQASALRAAIAQFHGVEPQRLIFGAGSDELFSIACQTFLGSGDNAVQPEWGFAAWRIAVKAAGAEMRSAPECCYAVDVDAVLRCVDDRTKIVFVANPANPTGSCIPFSEIERLHAALAPSALLIVDSAYAEFAAGEPGFDGGLALSASAPNVLMTRTFSKIYGLAALRIGWGHADAPVIDAMDRVRLPFNTTGPAQAAAIEALRDQAFVTLSREHVRREREGLEGFFKDNGVRTIATRANFVTALFNDAPQAARIDARLAEQGVLVRALASYGMANGMRVTIGTAAQMERFRRAFLAAASA